MSGATARAPEDEAAANGLATKADLANLKADLKDTLASKDDLKELKTDLKDDLKELKAELKADRKELKADVLKVATIIVGALASVGIITAATIGLVQLLFG